MWEISRKAMKLTGHKKGKIHTVYPQLRIKKFQDTLSGQARPLLPMQRAKHGRNIFRVSNNYVAFRYNVASPGRTGIQNILKWLTDTTRQVR